MDERKRITELFKALGNQARLAVLEALYRDKDITNIHREMDMSRSGLQNNIERLVDADLLYRPSNDNRTYDLTILGDVVAEHVFEMKASRKDIMDVYSEMLEEELREKRDILRRMEDADVDTGELEQNIQSRAWVKTREAAETTDE